MILTLLDPFRTGWLFRGELVLMMALSAVVVTAQKEKRA